jgi:hypothetical protein
LAFARPERLYSLPTSSARDKRSRRPLPHHWYLSTTAVDGLCLVCCGHGVSCCGRPCPRRCCSQRPVLRVFSELASWEPAAICAQSGDVWGCARACRTRSPPSPRSRCRTRQSPHSCPWRRCAPLWEGVAIDAPQVWRGCRRQSDVHIPMPSRCIGWVLVELQKPPPHTPCLLGEGSDLPSCA